MTHEQLLEIAKRKGVVRWLKSDVIELLHVGNLKARKGLPGQRDQVFAGSVFTKSRHWIRPRAEHHCVEVQMTDHVTGNQLLPHRDRRTVIA